MFFARLGGMKHTALPALLACFFLGSACVPLPPPAPFSGQFSGAGEAVYRRGYHLGFQDGKRSRDDDYERHHYEYEDDTEDAFARGYELGYEAGEEQAGADEEDRDRAKNDGYNAGRTDAENGLSPFYQRHRSAYTEATEADFRKAYVRGYNAGRDDGPAVGDRRAYGEGYRQGELDAERGRPARPESFSDAISPSEEPAYMQGYRDGYRHAVPRH